MDKLSKKVKKILDKQDLADNSKTTYLSNFLKVRDLSNHKGFSFNFLKNVSRITKLINDSGEKDTSKKMMFISISAIAKGSRGLKKKSDIYRDLSLKITKELNKQYSLNQLSKKQKDTLITRTELLKKVDNIRETFNRKPNKSNKKKLILALLYIETLFTPRLDYRDMKIITRKDQDNDKDNFLLIKNTGMGIILNEYKTKDKYGKIVFKLEDNIQKELRKLGIQNQKLVFESNKGGKAIRRNKFSEFVKNTFDGIGVNGIRIIKETYLQKQPFFRSLPAEQQEKKHNQLFQHSGFIARSVYRKIQLK